MFGLMEIYTHPSCSNTISNLISELLLCVIIMRLYVLILLFLIYTNCVIGSNEASYAMA
jgi:hypothetical protein